MMFSLAWRWSSLTQAFALSSDDYWPISMCLLRMRSSPYRLGDIIDDDGAVGVSVVHGRQRLVALLACRVPDLELDRCGFVEGDGLCQEGGANGGLPVVVELVLLDVSLDVSAILTATYFDKTEH